MRVKSDESYDFEVILNEAELAVIKDRRPFWRFNLVRDLQHGEAVYLFWDLYTLDLYLIGYWCASEELQQEITNK